MKSHNTCKCQWALRHTLSALAVLVFLGWAAVAQGAEKTWNADAGDYFTPAPFRHRASSREIKFPITTLSTWEKRPCETRMDPS